MRKLVVFGVALLLAGCAAPGPLPLQAAVDECRLNGSDLVVLEDDGTTLLIDHKGEDDLRGMSIEKVDCLLDALEIPGSVRQKMGQTRAMDGMQSAEWDQVTATWTYHPDTGLDLILEWSPSGG
jgi:hypothetical protein